MSATGGKNGGPGQGGGTLGTFAGVFTPSILTILGIILFLRLGYVVGSGGLARALVLIVLANTISVLTSVSLSAIATNLRVKGGGDYYLISRTLGLEFGGALGVVLFLAQSVSIAFYCIGFGEALTDILPVGGRHMPRIVAAAAVSFLFVFAWLGADVATRFQYAVMAILVLALGSFVAGGIGRFDADLLARNWARPADALPFWALFAVFFPAVTGFTQGVSMSGDLRDPGRSLPRGTFAAVGLSGLVYLCFAFLLAGSLPRDILSQDYAAMKRVASLSFLVDAGVIAATLSSGLASFLGAPRILQSLAQDRIFPFLMPFAEGVGPHQNPRRGVLLSAGIAYATIALGNLNLVAPVVSMFFLISYGLLNAATYYEARAASPSFRPRFRWFDQRLSLLGALCCLGAMLAIDLAAGLAAVAVLFSIYQYLQRTAGPARWADTRRSYHLHQAREHLLAASREPEHPRDWRPRLLTFSEDAKRREPLLRFAAWVAGPSGITTVVQVLEGSGLRALRQRAEVEKDLRKSLAEHHPDAFPLVVAVPNLPAGLEALVQAFGIGPLRANTVLLNWLEQAPRADRSGRHAYGRNLRTAFRLGCNIIVLSAREEAWATLAETPGNARRIDLWWWGDRTSRLMLLLSYLLSRSDDWRGARIRVLAAQAEADYDRTVEDLRQTLEEVRISAEPEVVLHSSVEAVAEHSANAALVFLPFRLSRNRLVGPFGGNVEDLIAPLPVAALVLASEDIELDAEPEAGKSAEMAAATDAYQDARKRSADLEREATQAREEAEAWLEKLEKAAASGAGREEIARAEKSAVGLLTRAEKAARRAAKAMARVEDAARVLEDLGVVLEKKEAKEGEEGAEDRDAEEEGAEKA